MSIEAMKQALEALEYGGLLKKKQAITSLRQAIEQAEKQVSYSGNGTAGRENMTAPTGFFFQMPKAEKQEPVGRVVSANCEYATVQWLRQTSEVGGGDPKNSRSWPIAGDAVYTTPQPQREWVGLTDNEMLMIYGQQHEGEKYSLGRMVEQALKEKNT